MRYEADVISRNIKKKQKLRKILITIFYITLIPTILFSLILILVELGNSYELPSFLNIDIYTVVSDSMNPKIKVNDIVLVKKGLTNDEFKVGNIITFYKDNGEIITHRITKIINSDLTNAYITKGDNNEAEDPDVVKYENIIGKVIYVMPNLGTAMQVLKNKAFLFACILALILTTAYDLKIRKRQEQRKKIREKYEKKSSFYF